MTILNNVAWFFNGISYDSPEEFSEAVMQYQSDAGRDVPEWQPGSVVLDAPEVQIVYRYYITPNDIKFPDEQYLDEDEADVQVDDPEEEDEQREVAVTFHAANKQHFTAAELLYKLHQRLWHRQLGDLVHFNGLLSCKPLDTTAVPRFYLHCND